MTEAISVPTETAASLAQSEPKETIKFARDYLGLKPGTGATMENGQSYYPAPDTIDELIKTRYIRVAEPDSEIKPRKVLDEITGFTTTGQIIEIKAQSLLNAISIGFIPNSRLELQIQSLMHKLGIQSESWSESPMVLTEAADPEEEFDGEKFAKSLLDEDKRFRNVRGTSGQLRSVKSIFIDEGWIDGGIVGLAAQDKEFIVSSDETMNKATIVPLTKDLKGKLQVGVVTEYMPVPQRHKGNGLTLTSPCFALPKDVETIEDARKYIAQLYEIPLDCVWRLGESYYSHVGVTPERIFPFAIASKGKKNNPIGGPFQFAPMSYIWEMFAITFAWNQNQRFMANLYDVYNTYGFGSDFFLDREQGMKMSAPSHTPRIHSAVDIAGRATMSAGSTPSSAPPTQTQSIETASDSDFAPDLKNLEIMDGAQDSAWRPGDADLLDSKTAQEEFSHNQHTSPSASVEVKPGHEDKK